LRVFVAGASGAIGRPLVRQLVAAGHEVTGMTRRAERAEEITAAGAAGLVCDVFDAGRLAEVVAGARPEVVVHQLTALPQALDIRRRDVYDATNLVRSEGTRNLVAAARSAGASRLVAQSIAFLYAPVGGWVKSEDDPVIERAPGHFGEAMRVMVDLERQVLEADGIEGLILRYGFFYGPGGVYDSRGYQADEVRKRRFPVIPSDARTSFIHLEDAAAATVAACERGDPGIYNVVDDDPALMREWVPAYAQAIGAKPPFRVPKLIARLVAGRALTQVATTSRGASNAKAKRELRWQPRYASWRRGFVEGLT
jgi:nucleoside-diphosphate-sugar epimerase